MCMLVTRKNNGFARNIMIAFTLEITRHAPELQKPNIIPCKGSYVNNIQPDFVSMYVPQYRISAIRVRSSHFCPVLTKYNFFTFVF